MEQQTLFKELNDWNKQENTFRQLFSPEALKDRKFIRMKLRAYDRLFHKYSGKPLTTDEKALVRMLQFQRRKMERVLFRGLISRLLRFTASTIRGAVIRRREAVLSRDSVSQYVMPAPSSGREKTESISQLESRETSIRQYPVSKFDQEPKRRHIIKNKGQGI